MNNKNSTTRVALVLMAILAVILAVVCILRTEKTVEEDTQSDLSGYGTEDPSVNQGAAGLIFEDDATVEMDSIPNDAMITSGGDVSEPASTADAQ